MTICEKRDTDDAVVRHREAIDTELRRWREYQTARHNVQTTYIDAVFSVHKVRPGSVVRAVAKAWAHGVEIGDELLVTKIAGLNIGENPPGIYCKHKKKDGSWGKVEHYFGGEYEVVTP